MMMKRYTPILALTVAVLGGLFMSTGVQADPPDQSGQIVFRYDLYYGWGYRTADLWAIHGFDIVHWCSLGCPGDPVNPECFITDQLHTIQDIVSPADLDLLIELVKGDDLWTTVWPRTPGVGLCETVAAMQGVPLAFGTVDLISTDNDLFANLVHNRMNSYKVSAHGVVETPEGDRHQFSGRVKCVWHPLRNPGRCNRKINLSP